MKIKKKSHDSKIRVPVAVGNAKSQKAFINANLAFIGEYERLDNFTKRVFLRRFKITSREEARRLRALPDDDPELIEAGNRYATDWYIFYLGRMTRDDFGEILMLAANGYGFGAYKIVRGMYERLVTALYLDKHPQEARSFADDSTIFKEKYLKRIIAADPNMGLQISEEFMHELGVNAAAARAKRRESMCSKCDQPITQSAWTRKSLDVMARDVAPVLADHYPSLYLEGTAQSHANSFGLERRIMRLEGGGLTYQATSEEEGRSAVHFGHLMMIGMLSLQNEHFNVGLAQELQARIDAFLQVWGAAQMAAAT